MITKYIRKYIRKLIVQGFKELLKEHHLIYGVDSVDVVFENKDPVINELKHALTEAVTYKYKKEMKQDLQEWIDGEEFIDGIIKRINKKQITR